MKFLIVVESTLTNSEWVAEYLPNVASIVASFGGRYLTRAGNVELLEGVEVPPQYALVAEFPDREAALNFYNSEAYAPWKKIRQQNSRARILLVPVSGVS